jgi:hypothetical protein
MPQDRLRAMLARRRAKAAVHEHRVHLDPAIVAGSGGSGFDG